MNKLISRISLIVLMVFPLLCMGLMVLFVIGKGHCNHTGGEILMILLPLGLTMIVAIMTVISKNQKKAARIALALNILAVIFFIGIDRFNIMVQYDRWLERGMPARFERAR